jgi:1,2-diacylglycerol 3-beta-galactosyltransferase
MVNLQEILDPLDLWRRLTGTRLQDLYNTLLRNGWTLGSPCLLRVLQAVIRSYHGDQVRLLREFWRDDPPDLAVSLVPHFNRALREGISSASPRTPFVTILTDLADYPPHFWIEPQEQFFICGTAKAVAQARAMGISENLIFPTSGMIVHPRFYEPLGIDPTAERLRLGLDPSLPTGLVMFGGQGSKAMLEIGRRLDEAALDLQLIFICGRNEKLAAELKKDSSRRPRLILGFTTEIPYYMSLADFFIGKPGPGSISEALVMNLPVVVQKDSWTLPQERYNAEWIREQQVGIVVSRFRNIAAAVADLLSPDNFPHYRSNAAAFRNRAVFEIPGLLKAILEERKSPLIACA